MYPILPNSFVHCFVLCVWVRVSRPCMLLLALDVLFRLAFASALLVWFLFMVLRGSSLSLLLFGLFCVVAISFFVCPGGLGACGLARSLLVSLLPLVVFWCFLVQSVFCWSSLRISDCICNGPVVIPLAWRVVADWLLSSLRFMATKASALCGLCPLTPCCGCCSCAPRSGTEVFALG